jgi:NAD(P)-dependent dehydrogenase (short-subunit alcohol dehydrogenase family)
MPVPPSEKGRALPDYRNKVAVVTGAAGGIGYAVATRAAAEGMTVVLADIDTERLDQAAASLGGRAAGVHAFEVDVALRESVQRLATRVQAEVGDVWLLVNNAGVYLSAPFVEMPLAQWEFVVGVNLWGVVHCLQAFLPGMVARDSGYVVNTSSIDGLVTVRNATSYVAAKHAVTALSETLFRELEEAGSAVGVSVLCPAAVDTDILRSAAHWPDRLGPAPAMASRGYPPLDGVMRPEQVADILFAGLVERRFWILTHPEQGAAAIRGRADGIVAARNPDDESVDPNFRRSTGRTPS